MFTEKKEIYQEGVTKRGYQERFIKRGLLRGVYPEERSDEGMKGIDEEYALLKMVRAHLCVKRKNLIANEKLEAAQYAGMYQRAYLYA